jgi:hypothetical protein
MKLALLATVALLAIPASAFAECPTPACITFKVPTGSSKYVVSQNVEIGDVPGHIVRLFRTDSVPSGAEIGGLKITQISTRGTGELYNNEGSGIGYMEFTAENGDKLFARNALVAQMVGGKPFVTWVGRIIGGTGKLAGLHGTTKLTSNFDTSPAGQVSNSTFEIDLAK